MIGRVSIAAAVALVACERARVDPPQSRDAAFDSVTVATKLAGCYELDSPNLHYAVRLRAVRSGTSWAANHLGYENRGGNSWSWLPADTSHFYIEWGGIDAARSFSVAREQKEFVGEATLYSGTPVVKTTEPVQVRRIDCRSEGA